MNHIYEDTYLADILHDISQGVLLPTMVCIVVLIAITIFFLAQVIIEFATEWRHYKQNMPEIINELNDAPYSRVVQIIYDSKLLRFQKAALIIVARNMGLPEEPLFALAQTQIAKAEKGYEKRLGWTDTVAKIAPLLGMMGTLIPLGPGIVALGQNDLTGLSQSLSIAFDSTVCGLICAIIAMVISKIRAGWYNDYVQALEALMSCVVDKAEDARKEGVQLPANYTGNPMKEFAEQERKAARASQADQAAEQAAPAAEGVEAHG